jgi:glycosyltransferase involved in cell wall biosynthesis
LKVSLVLPTIQTDKNELTRFLDSVAVQSHFPIDLIIVDQNIDERVSDIIQSYRNDLQIIHLHSSPGLSLARNIGLQAISGDLVAFPDDDCWYPPDLLARVVEQLDAHPDWAGITGQCLDQTGKPAVGKWDPRRGPITIYNVWNRSTSITIFLRTSIIQKVGEFDESLGVGSGTPRKSGEETDYLLRVLEKGFHLEYIPTLEVYHPPALMEGREANHKAFSYSLGVGWVLRKHRLPFWFVFSIWLKTAGGFGKAWLSGDIVRANYIRSILIGRIRGFMQRDR